MQPGTPGNAEASGATRQPRTSIISARAESRRCPANDDARASAAAMMWELLGEGRRLLEDGEWRRQPPRLA